MAQVETIPIDGWAEGLNTQVSPDRLSPNELAVAENVEFGPRGALRLRKGFTTVVDVAEDFEWVWGWEVSASDGLSAVYHVILVTDATPPLFKWYTDGFAMTAPIAPAGSAVLGGNVGYLAATLNAVVLNDMAYVTRAMSTDRGFELDPTPGAEAVTELTVWDGLGTVTAEYPSAVAVAVAYDRVFAANIRVPGAGFIHPERLWFSQPLLPKSWTSTNFIDISPDQNQQIVSIKFFNGQIVILKTGSMWAISGSDFSSLEGVEVYNISNAYGTKSPYSVVDTGSLLIFLDPSEGIVAYDGSGFTVLSTPVWEAMREGLDPATERPFAWFHSQRYFISFPNGFTWVYDFRGDIWSQWTYLPSAVSVLNGQLIAVGPARDGLWLLEDGYSDGPEDALGASNYTMSAETGWLSPGSPGLQQRLRGFEVDYEAGTNDDAGEIIVFLDGDSSTEAANIFPSSLETDVASTQRFHQLNNQRWRRLKFRFEFSAVNEGLGADIVGPFSISGMRLQISALPRARGPIG